jgi:hypothetical protein
LYAKSFGGSAADNSEALLPGQQSDETQFLFIAHSSLDIFEEKLATNAAPGAAADLYLGLLYPTDTYQVFGYVTNTKAKLVVITDDADVKDLDVKSVRLFFFCYCCFNSLFFFFLLIAMQAIASFVCRCSEQSILHARRAAPIHSLRQGDCQACQHVLSDDTKHISEFAIEHKKN